MASQILTMPTYWDTYVPPSVDDEGIFVAGTGFGAADDNGVLVDYGYQFILRMANPGGGSELGIRSPGWVMTVNLPSPDGSGGSGTSEDVGSISSCTEAIVAIADPDDPCDEPSSDEPNEDGQIIMIVPCGLAGQRMESAGSGSRRMDWGRHR